MTFGKGSVEGSWKWGGTGSAKGIKVYILGNDFAESDAWDVHMKKVVASCKRLTSCIVLLVTGTFT